MGSVVAVGLALFMSLALLPSAPARAETVRARYAVRYLSLPVGEMTAIESVGDPGYRINLQARVSGLASLASSFSTTITAQGTIRRGAILPSAFAADETGADVGRRRIRMVLDAGDVKTLAIDLPPGEPEERVPIRAEHKRGIVDPGSALVLAMSEGAASAGQAACNRTLRVFNGAFRADLALSFLRAERMAISGYSGPVSVCSLRYTPVAGHKPSAAMVRFMAANRDIEVRLAVIAGAGVALLVRATIPLPVGTATIELKRLDVGPDG